jgi:hypothetical protein
MRTPRRTRLAVATVDDVHRLRATFTKEPTLNILPRPDDELERAAEAGWAIMLLYGNELVAHAYAFAVSGSPVVELGGAEVASGFQGHRIQKELLFPVRVAAVLESHGPEVPITTVIDPNNVRSVDNAKAVGFVPWEAPDEALFVDCIRCAKQASATNRGSRCCSTVYHLPWKSAVQCVRTLLRNTERATSLFLPGREGAGLVVDVSGLALLGESRRRILWDLVGTTECNEPA